MKKTFLIVVLVAALVLLSATSALFSFTNPGMFLPHNDGYIYNFIGDSTLFYLVTGTDTTLLWFTATGGMYWNPAKNLDSLRLDSIINMTGRYHTGDADSIEGKEIRGTPSPGDVVKYGTDSMYYGTDLTGGGGGGWTDDGTVVRLSTVGDSVGIGTASPKAKLQVAGSAIIEGRIDSVESIGGKGGLFIEIGKDWGGGVQIYGGDGQTNPLISFGSTWPSNGSDSIAVLGHLTFTDTTDIRNANKIDTDTLDIDNVLIFGGDTLDEFVGNGLTIDTTKDDLEVDTSVIATVGHAENYADTAIGDTADDLRAEMDDTAAVYAGDSASAHADAVRSEIRDTVAAIGHDADSIQGVEVSPAAPTNTQVLKYNSDSSRWIPAADETGAGGASLVVEEDSVTEVAAADTLNFLAPFDLTNTAGLVKVHIGLAYWEALIDTSSVAYADSAGKYDTNYAALLQFVENHMDSGEVMVIVIDSLAADTTFWHIAYDSIVAWGHVKGTMDDSLMWRDGRTAVTGDHDWGDNNLKNADTGDFDYMTMGQGYVSDSLGIGTDATDGRLHIRGQSGDTDKTILRIEGPDSTDSAFVIWENPEASYWMGIRGSDDILQIGATNGANPLLEFICHDTLTEVRFKQCVHFWTQPVYAESPSYFHGILATPRIISSLATDSFKVEDTVYFIDVLRLLNDPVGVYDGVNKQTFDKVTDDTTDYLAAKDSVAAWDNNRWRILGSVDTVEYKGSEDSALIRIKRNTGNDTTRITVPVGVLVIEADGTPVIDFNMATNLDSLRWDSILNDIRSPGGTFVWEDSAGHGPDSVIHADSSQHADAADSSGKATNDGGGSSITGTYMRNGGDTVSGYYKLNDSLTILNGNLGIGIESSNLKLHVYDGTDDVAIQVQTAKANGYAAVALQNDTRQWTMRVAPDDAFEVVNELGGPTYPLTIETSNRLTVLGSIAMQADSTVDGIDISEFHSDYATDSAKLDGIEAGATADQTVVDSAVIAADAWSAHNDKDGDSIDVSAYEVQLNDEAGLYTVLSNVSNFVQDAEVPGLETDAAHDNFSELSGTVGDAQIADGAVDGGAGGEIADNSVTMQDDMATFTEVQLETQLSNVTDVFTNNDGALNDDNVTPLDLGTASANIADDGTIEWEDATDLDANGALKMGCVSDNEIDYSTVTLWDFDYQTAYKTFYSDAAGDVSELTHGASGKVLTSNGASSDPTWETPAAAWNWDDSASATSLGAYWVDSAKYAEAASVASQALTLDHIDSSKKFGIKGLYIGTDTTNSDSLAATHGYVDSAALDVSDLMVEGDIGLTGRFNQWGYGHVADLEFAHAAVPDTWIFFPCWFEDWDNAVDSARCMDSSAAIHPAEVYVPDGLWGFTSWMGYGPYCWGTSGGEITENPHIAVSNDGITYTEFISGNDTLHNPLWTYRDTFTFGNDSFYSITNLSDQDLFYAQDQKLYMPFRARWQIAGTDSHAVFVGGTSDGINWSDPKPIISHGMVGGTHPHSFLSPTFLHFPDTYKVWTVEYFDENPVGDTASVVLWQSTRPDTGYTLNDTCDWTPSSDSAKPWHIEAIHNGADEIIFFVTECSLKHAGEPAWLCLAYSHDGGHTVVTNPTIVMAPTASGLFSTSVYRATGHWENQAEHQVIKLYVTAIGDYHHHTALSEISFSSGYDTTEPALEQFVENCIADTAWLFGDTGSGQDAGDIASTDWIKDSTAAIGHTHTDTIDEPIAYELIHGNLGAPGDSVRLSLEARSGFGDALVTMLCRDTMLGTDETDTVVFSISSMPHGIISVDSVVLIYRMSSTTDASIKIDRMLLRGPKAGNLVADTTFIDSTADVSPASANTWTSRTWTMATGGAVNRALYSKSQQSVIVFVVDGDAGHYVDFHKVFAWCSVKKEAL